MKKAFSKAKIENFIQCSNNLVSAEDIINGKAYKILKTKLNSLSNFKNIILFSNDEEKENILKKYFPLKYQTLTSNHYVKSGGINGDKKVFLNVIDNENTRCFLLKTEDIKRIKPEINSILLRFKNRLDKIYGYWYYDNFITDLNKFKTSYRVIDNDINNWYVKEER